MKCALPGRYNKGKPVSSNNMSVLDSISALSSSMDYSSASFESVVMDIYGKKYIVEGPKTNLQNNQSVEDLKKEISQKYEELIRFLDKARKEMEVDTKEIKMGYNKDELDVLEEMAKKDSEGG